MPTRPCLEPGCSALVHTPTGSRTRRCATHQASAQRAKDARRPTRRSHAEQQRKRQTIADHIALVGYLCPGCPLSRWQPHPADPASNPLTANHVLAVANGGREDGPLEVMCRDGNSSLAARPR